MGSPWRSVGIRNCIMKSLGTSSALDAAQRLLELHHRPAGADEAPASSHSCSICDQKWPCDAEVVAAALLRANPDGHLRPPTKAITE